MKTIAEYQIGMPKKMRDKHAAMSAAACRRAADDLIAESMKCDYFGNTCPMRGPDALAQMSDNFDMRAKYFNLLAAMKEAKP